LKDVAYVNQK